MNILKHRNTVTTAQATCICAQGSKLPSTSRVILCQWHSAIFTN